MNSKFVGLVLLSGGLALSSAPSAIGSCMPMTKAEQRARADVIFDGVALENATPTGKQRFRVRRYLKGKRPSIVAVATGVIRRRDGSGSVTSVSIDVRRGELWRIYARATATGLQTSSCDGSWRLARANRTRIEPTSTPGTGAAGSGPGLRPLPAAAAMGAAALAIAVVGLSLIRRHPV